LAAAGRTTHGWYGEAASARVESMRAEAPWRRLILAAVLGRRGRDPVRLFSHGALACEAGHGVGANRKRESTHAPSLKIITADTSLFIFTS